MNVKEIISEYLEKNGYDGLCGPGCGCDKNDLFPCGENSEDCIPGYKHLCKDCVERCEYFYHDEQDCYSPTKQIKPIRTVEDYDNALEHLNILSASIEKYEEEHFPIEKPKQQEKEK